MLAILVVAPLYVSVLYLRQSQAADNPWMALQSTDRAQRFNPVGQEPVEREAELAEEIGDWPRAERAYERAIQLGPEHNASYVRLAQFHERRGETEEFTRDIPAGSGAQPHGAGSPGTSRGVRARDLELILS